MVFTNVFNPRSEISTVHGRGSPHAGSRGASLGANCTIICGIMIGQYAFIGAGAVVLRDVPDYALVMGNSAESSGGCLFVGIESISIKRTDPVYVKP